jgi:hypothetical protein
MIHLATWGKRLDCEMEVIIKVVPRLLQRGSLERKDASLCDWEMEPCVKSMTAMVS